MTLRSLIDKGRKIVCRLIAVASAGASPSIAVMAPGTGKARDFAAQGTKLTVQDGRIVWQNPR